MLALRTSQPCRAAVRADRGRSFVVRAGGIVEARRGVGGREVAAPHKLSSLVARCDAHCGAEGVINLKIAKENPKVPAGREGEAATC